MCILTFHNIVNILHMGLEYFLKPNCIIDVSLVTDKVSAPENVMCFLNSRVVFVFRKANSFLEHISHFI